MGEFELLARIRERLPADGASVRLGSGDDAAITTPGGATATSVDALVEGVHFHRDWATLAQIGHKALAAALSDLAAMGARPGEAYAVLGIPPDLDEDGCIELLDGMAGLAGATGTSLAGGDLTRAAELFLAITVVGHAPDSDLLIHRDGARPGDALVLTGELGGAAAGLALLEDPALGTGIPSAADLRARQLQPRPRLGCGRALASAGARAMIDLSDGLGGDALRLAERSGVGLQIDGEVVPRAAGVNEVALSGDRDPWQLLAGGEDYELLAALPPERLEQAQRATQEAEGIPLAKIGEVVAGEGAEIRLPGGRVLGTAGYDQLA